MPSVDRRSPDLSHRLKQPGNESDIDKYVSKSPSALLIHNTVYLGTGNISLKLDTIDGSIEYVVEKIDFIFGVGNKILESQDLVLQNQGRSKDQHAEHDAFMKNCFERLFSDYEKQAEELRHIKENQEHQNALLKKQHGMCA